MTAPGRSKRTDASAALDVTSIGRGSAGEFRVLGVEHQVAGRPELGAHRGRGRGEIHLTGALEAARRSRTLRARPSAASRSSHRRAHARRRAVSSLPESAGSLAAQREQRAIQRQASARGHPSPVHPSAAGCAERALRLRVRDPLACAPGSENSGKRRELAAAALRSRCLPSSGSRSVKYWNGVEAAHSWPMKSSGVIGTVSRRTLAARHVSGGDRVVQAIAQSRGSRPDRGSARTRRTGASARGRGRCRAAAFMCAECCPEYSQPSADDRRQLLARCPRSRA